MSGAESRPRHYDFKERDDWETPDEILDAVRDGLGTIYGDPCAKANTSIGEKYNYRLEDGQDGLELDWDAPNWFVNPPFSYKDDWLEKAVEEVESGNADTVIVLTDDGTSTKSWWHKWIALHAEFICFTRGRTQFELEGEKQGSPPFNTVLSVFGDSSLSLSLAAALDEIGHVVVTV